MSQELSTKVEGSTGIIELERPRALNSLSGGMIDGIREAVDEWMNDGSVEQVLIRSSSQRAFCAGGDVRAVAEDDAEGFYHPGDEFFEREYGLNRRLATYPKPIIALLEGVVMGGGFGISAHGSHRVVTASTVGAMPEAAIGFVPDVGMTFRLTHLEAPEDVADQLPERIALAVFLGTTGWRMNAADMLATGLATHFTADPQAFGEAVAAKGLKMALREHTMEPAAALESPEVGEPSKILANAKLIEEIFGAGSWQEVSAALEKAEAPDEAGEEFLAVVRDALATANPTSLVAITEIMRHSAHTDLETALRNEFAMGAKLRRESNFPEGVRAVLVDKDHAPKFSPAQAADVDAAAWRDVLED